MIFFRHDLSTFTGSLLLSEFECPRTILIKKKQQQQQHIFIFIKKELKKKLLPATLDKEPSTLDPRQKDRPTKSFCRGSRVDGSMSRVELNNH